MASQVDINGDALTDKIVVAVQDILKNLTVSGPQATDKASTDTEVARSIGETVARRLAATMEEYIDKVQSKPSLNMSELRRQIIANTRAAMQLRLRGSAVFNVHTDFSCLQILITGEAPDLRAAVVVFKPDNRGVEQRYTKIVMAQGSVAATDAEALLLLAQETKAIMANLECVIEYV